MKIQVLVHPNAKNPRIEKDLLGDTHVYVSSPPLEGKANKEAVEALAKHFNVSKSKVVLLSGQKSKNKLFSVG